MHKLSNWIELNVLNKLDDSNRIIINYYITQFWQDLTNRKALTYMDILMENNVTCLPTRRQKYTQMFVLVCYLFPTIHKFERVTS